MSNVISQQLHRAIQREYRLRVISVIIFFLALSIFASGLLLIPTYLNIQNRLATVYYQIKELEKSHGVINDATSQRKALLVEKRLVHIEQGHEPALEQFARHSFIMSALPENVRYSLVQFGSDQDQSWIQFSGNATNRSDLSLIIDELESLSWVKQVAYPLSDLAKPSNINFTITLYYNPADLDLIDYDNVSVVPENLDL